VAEYSPFTESPTSDADDLGLVRQAQGGSREALESLIRRHQPWIYNIESILELE